MIEGISDIKKKVNFFLEIWCVYKKNRKNFLRIHSIFIFNIKIKIKQSRGNEVDFSCNGDEVVLILYKTDLIHVIYRLSMWKMATATVGGQLSTHISSIAVDGPQLGKSNTTLLPSNSRLRHPTAAASKETTAHYNAGGCKLIWPHMFHPFY